MSFDPSVRSHMRLIDTHAHLDHIKDLALELEQASRRGVAAIVGVSTNIDSSLRNLEIRRECSRPLIHVAAGIHPSDVSGQNVQACVDLIRERRADICAVGEIGLDFWYPHVRSDLDKKEQQRKVFRALLELANELRLPVVIHSRGTWRECFQTAKSVGILKAVFHWYSGPLDVLKDIMDQGYYISASPALVYSLPSKEAVKFAPIDQTLIETDSPVFYRQSVQADAADPKDGFQAGPKDVFRTLDAYCALKGMDPDEASGIFNNNACRLFGIDGGSPFNH